MMATVLDTLVEVAVGRSDLAVLNHALTLSKAQHAEACLVPVIIKHSAKIHQMLVLGAERRDPVVYEIKSNALWHTAPMLCRDATARVLLEGYMASGHYAQLAALREPPGLSTAGGGGIQPPSVYETIEATIRHYSFSNLPLLLSVLADQTSATANLGKVLQLVHLIAVRGAGVGLQKVKWCPVKTARVVLQLYGLYFKHTCVTASELVGVAGGAATNLALDLLRQAEAAEPLPLREPCPQTHPELWRTYDANTQYTYLIKHDSFPNRVEFLMETDAGALAVFIGNLWKSIPRRSQIDAFDRIGMHDLMSSLYLALKISATPMLWPSTSFGFYPPGEKVPESLLSVAKILLLRGYSTEAGRHLVALPPTWQGRLANTPPAGPLPLASEAPAPTTAVPNAPVAPTAPVAPNAPVAPTAMAQPEPHRNLLMSVV